MTGSQSPTLASKIRFSRSEFGSERALDANNIEVLWSHIYEFVDEEEFELCPSMFKRGAFI